MKPLNWVELTRQQIKARHGFGWSIQGIEKQNKVITKIVYRFSNGQSSPSLVIGSNLTNIFAQPESA